MPYPPCCEYCGYMISSIIVDRGKDGGKGGFNALPNAIFHYKIRGF